MPTSSEAKATDDPSYRPPGLVALLSALSEAPLVQSAGYVTTTPTITYIYDPLSRLAGASYSTGEQFEYAYDGVGNRTAYTVTLGSTTVTTYTYDAANRLTSVGDVAYTWDARGNLTNDGTFAYTYNAAGRLVGAQSLTATLVYTYTADGLRVAQSVNSSVMTTTWDLALPLAQVLATSDGARDLYGLRRIAEVQGSAWAYVLPDALGSARQWADGGGVVVYAGGYAPYGEPLWQEGSTASAWGFTGEWWDAEMGLLYLRARWYAAYLNRFTSPDPIVPDFRDPQSINDYVYVLDNPVNYTDPTGLCTMCTEGSTVTVYDPWSYDQGVALRGAPLLNAPVVGRVPNGSRVTIREDAPVLGSGIDWHSSDIPLGLISPGVPVGMSIRVWLRNQDLLDNLEPGSYPDVPNPFGLRFNRPPVAIGSITSVQGFGATRFACNRCGGGDGQGECQNFPCDYQQVRGLHNGLDLSVPDGTVVYWTGNGNGVVVNKFPRDARPNVVIQVGTYYVLFGHLSEIWVQENQFVWGGYASTPIGTTGSGHLHMGVRTESKFHNPLYFFESSLADRLTGLMGEYIEAEGPWSMLAYTYSQGWCMNYFWGCNPDRTGIDRP